MSTVLDVAPKTNSGFPESDQLYEIVDSERVETVLSSYATWITNRLANRLTNHVEAESGGTVVSELMFGLDEERNLRQRPDVAYLSAEKWPVGAPLPPTGDWGVIPDLAVEVLSPSNRDKDVLRKLRDDSQYGVREVWPVSPAERIVHVFTSPDQLKNLHVGESLTTPLIPCRSISVETLLPHEAAPSVNDD